MVFHFSVFWQAEKFNNGKNLQNKNLYKIFANFKIFKIYVGRINVTSGHKNFKSRNQCTYTCN